MIERESDNFSEQETVRRRDEVIRRMANTPPQPKSKTPNRPKRKRKAGASRAADKSRVRRER